MFPQIWNESFVICSTQDKKVDYCSAEINFNFTIIYYYLHFHYLFLWNQN